MPRSPSASQSRISARSSQWAPGLGVLKAGSATVMVRGAITRPTMAIVRNRFIGWCSFRVRARFRPAQDVESHPKDRISPTQDDSGELGRAATGSAFRDTTTTPAGAPRRFEHAVAYLRPKIG